MIAIFPDHTHPFLSSPTPINSFNFEILHVVSIADAGQSMRIHQNSLKGLTSWLSFVMFNCVFVTFLSDILGQTWYLIVSIPDLWHLFYFSQDAVYRL